MMLRSKIILALVGCIVAVVIFIAFLGTRSGQGPAATVSFAGFTNSSTGARFGMFHITNQLALRIARNGYCRLDGGVVDIMPTLNLEPGEAHTVQVPLSGMLQNEVYEVTFNGVRDLNNIDKYFDLAADLLQLVSIHWPWLDTVERRRWEATCEFKSNTELDSSANASQPIRSETIRTSSAAGSRR